MSRLNIRTVAKTSKIKSQLMQGAKDKVQPSREAGVIYALGCMECPRVYVGETAGTADLRSKEHQAHARYGRLEQSAVAKHAIEENHQIHWKPVVVTKERNTTKRKVKETLKIRELEKRGRKTMNQDSGMQLSKLWLNLV